jgi:DegV family protein with EDD domain
MSDRVRVVTDSSSGLSPEVAAAQGIRIVPLAVTAGAKIGLEGIEVTAADVLVALSARQPKLATSQPTAAAFAAAYEGDAPVVSIHLSAGLSGTCDVARAAARDAEADVRVVDSRLIAMGLGFVALAAARVVAEGGSVDEVEAAAITAAERTTVLFCVDTLEFLRRGGRIGAASALLGSALSVKPLLHLVDGAIGVRERVRTTSRAVTRLGELAENAVSAGTADLAVMHLDAPGRAQALADRLHERLPHCGHIGVSEVGAVIGAHTGPGVLGVAVHRH